MKFVDAVGSGMGVLRDIGNSDPERTAPPNVVNYLTARQPDWEKAGITMKVEDVIANEKKYPFCYAVNRATISNWQNKLQRNVNRARKNIFLF